MFKGSRTEEMEIRGRDMVSGLPKTITVYSAEIEEALRESVYLIVQAARTVLERTLLSYLQISLIVVLSSQVVEL